MRCAKVRDNDISLLLRKGDILIRQYQSSIETMITQYHPLFTEEELQRLRDILRQIKFYFDNSFSSANDKVEYLKVLLPLEEYLKPFVMKCWESEKEYTIVSWLKDDYYKPKEKTISASLASKDDFHIFCESSIGISYLLTSKSFLGALPTDAAVVIHEGEPSIYTILSTPNYIVDSYSLATTLITPYEIMRNIGKYCEIILDARYAVPNSVVYFQEDDLSLAEGIASPLGLPLQNLRQKEKK